MLDMVETVVKRLQILVGGEFPLPAIEPASLEDTYGADGAYLDEDGGRILLAALYETNIAHELGHHLDIHGLLPDWVYEVAQNFGDYFVYEDQVVRVEYDEEQAEYMNDPFERVARTVAAIYLALKGHKAAKEILEQLGAPKFME